MLNETAMDEDIHDQGIPGVKFSACHVLSTSKPYETIFDLGAIIDPFYQYSNRNFTSRSPIICLSCACYLSAYAIINQENGSWYCPFCHMVNPKFYADFNSIDPSNRIKAMRSFYEELQSKHFDYEEPIFMNSNNITINKSNTNTSNIRVFAIDESLCRCNETISLLKEGIFALDPSTEICIVVFGNHISILRLNGVFIGCNPVQVDVFSGLTDQSPLFLHLIKRGIYCASVSKLINSFDIIQNCLANIVLDSWVTKSNNSSQSYRVGCALDMIVKLAVAMQHSKTCLMGVNLILLTCRSIYLSKKHEYIAIGGSNATATNATMKSSVIEGYSLLGQWAFGLGCSIDVYYASMNTGNLDHLDAIACMSGGYVVVASSYSETQFRNSFIQLLSYNTRYSDMTSSSIQNESTSCFEISNLTMPTIEVRTCGRLEVDRLIGPILTTHDVLLHNAACKSSHTVVNIDYSKCTQNELVNKAAELTVDPSHVSHSLFFALNNNNGGNVIDKIKGIENSQDEVYKRLVDYSSKTVILCGIAARPVTEANNFRETSISVQLKPSKLNEEGDTDSSDAAAFVQFVVRYQIRRRSKGLNSSLHHDTLMKVTRVWTQRIAITKDIDEYIQGIDTKLWTYVISKEIVADYQSEIIGSFGGVLRKNKLNESGIYTYIPIRSDVVNRIEQLITEISLFWCGIAVNSSEVSSTYTYIQKIKINESCRVLYHLLQGPLLDGPSMQPMESYLLRTTFLRTSYKHAICMIMPSLKLATIALLQKQYVNTKTMIECNDSKDPESSRVNVESKNNCESTTNMNQLPLNNKSSSNITCNNSNNKTYKSLHRSFGRLGLIAVNPDTTCLFPGTISLLDAGDRIIIRENPINDEVVATTTTATTTLPTTPEELQEKHEIFELLKTIANKIASHRYPNPSIHILAVPRSPQERLLYSCLAPAHMSDSIEQLLENSNSEFSSKLSIQISKSDLEYIIKQAPITDQLSFNKYMQVTLTNEMFDKLTLNKKPNIKPFTNPSSSSQLDGTWYSSGVNIINANNLKTSTIKTPTSLSMERELPINNYNNNLFNFFTTTPKTQTSVKNNVNNKIEPLTNLYCNNKDIRNNNQELDVV